MADLERVANKRFRILEDYDKRKKQLEEHAVRLVVDGPDGPDPNQPMIPAVQSARVRGHCYSCGAAFWGVYNDYYCPDCTSVNEAERVLNQELHRLQREIRMIEAQSKLERLNKAKEEGNLDEVLAELGSAVDDNELVLP